MKLETTAAVELTTEMNPLALVLHLPTGDVSLPMERDEETGEPLMDSRLLAKLCITDPETRRKATLGEEHDPRFDHANLRKMCVRVLNEDSEDEALVVQLNNVETSLKRLEYTTEAGRKAYYYLLTEDDATLVAMEYSRPLRRALYEGYKDLKRKLELAEQALVAISDSATHEEALMIADAAIDELSVDVENVRRLNAEKKDKARDKQIAATLRKHITEPKKLHAVLQRMSNEMKVVGKKPRSNFWNKWARFIGRDLREEYKQTRKGEDFCVMTYMDFEAAAHKCTKGSKRNVQYQLTKATKR